MTAEAVTMDPRSSHIRYLEQVIFQVDTKWPHYRRLLSDLQEIAQTQPSETELLCLERAFIFGGRSLFGALFDDTHWTGVDVMLVDLPPAREGYQADRLKHPDCDARPVACRAYAHELPFPSERFDYVVVPNVVHHVRHQDGLFREMARVLKPGGKGYIFETLLRELHQIPHDFVRYTPWGFETQLEKAGLVLDAWRPAGGPFEAIAYCWDQAIQYLPEPLRSEKRAWLENTHFAELMALEASHPENLARAHTQFPIAYGVFFSKPDKHSWLTKSIV